MFCNYLWREPKDGTPRYVGWGSLKRPRQHLCHSHNLRLGNMLKKRIREDFSPEPEVTVCPHQSENYAKLVECCWIEKYGRLDLGTGTLFNLTDGGDKGGTPEGSLQGGQTASAVVHTCECGRQVRGPSFFTHQRKCRGLAAKPRRRVVGWRPTEDQKKQQSVRQRAAGLHWFTDGVQSKQLASRPEGWAPGRTAPEEELGKHWWNDGSRSTKSKSRPGPEWTAGMLRKGN